MQPIPERFPQAKRRPLGIKLLAIFFAFGASMCALTILLLLFSSSALDSIWRLNPNARVAFQSIGATLSILLMFVVGLACAFAAIGLAKRSRWGRYLALAILAINVAGDSINAFVRHDPRTLLGVPIGGALMWWVWKAAYRDEL